MRSPKTSGDLATSAEVLIEVFNGYKKFREIFTHACCLYPTAPFVTPEKLESGYNLLINTSADCVFPVFQFSYPIQRALEIENNKLKMFWPEDLNSLSQDLPCAYHDAGQFYWFNISRFLQNKKLFSNNSIPILMPKNEVQDIDSEKDRELAEMKYKLLRKNN